MTSVWAKYDPESGEILGAVMGAKDCPGDDYVLSESGDIPEPSSHYVLEGTMRAYTDQEKEAKANMPAGFTWCNKLRFAQDQRTPEQCQADALADCLASRAKAYPPLADFADAMYWLDKGDDTKMTAYLTACDKVKQDYPKPT
jgi:hypothetical protein